MQIKFTELLHEFSRNILVRIANGVVSKICSDGQETQWLVRHSAAQRGDFHVLFSDIDFSFYVRADEEKNITRLRKKYFLFKKIFPWLGELEIYTWKERDRLHELMQEWGEQHKRIRYFRKLNWMHYALAGEKRSLHRHKYQRAIKKCLARLGCKSGQQALDQLFPRMELPAHGHEHSLYHPYLSCWINEAHPKDGKPAYKLSSQKVALYAALLPPPLGNLPEDLRKIVAELRSQKSIGEHWRASNEIEAITVRAVNRGSARVSPEMLGWQRILLEQEPQIDKKTSGIEAAKLLLELGRELEFKIASDSMSPLIRTGDKIIVRYAPFHSLKRFDIIVFKMSEQLFCHCVKKTNVANRQIITAGLNNSTEDPPLEESHYVGRVDNFALTYGQRLRLLFRPVRKLPNR